MKNRIETEMFRFLSFFLYSFIVIYLIEESDVFDLIGGEKKNLRGDRLQSVCVFFIHYKFFFSKSNIKRIEFSIFVRFRENVLRLFLSKP